MSSEVLYVRIKPELRRSLLLVAALNKRKISAQLELILEEWLAINGKEIIVHEPN